jgi:hypothetical protein
MNMYIFFFLLFVLAELNSEFLDYEILSLFNSASGYFGESINCCLFCFFSFYFYVQIWVCPKFFHKEMYSPKKFYFWYKVV